MGSRVTTITDVVERQLCTGCGACAYAEPERFEMVDALHYGRRPGLRKDAPPETGAAFAICPGKGLSHDPGTITEQHSSALLPGWGPVLKVFEGYASDPEIRRKGSSGGAATALSLFSLEKRGMGKVVQIASRPDAPFLNQTVFSSSRDDLLANAGSRYAPASPCDRLGEVRDGEEMAAFVGKPCDVAAVRSAMARDKALKDKIGVTVGFFCAGAPSTHGNLELIRRQGGDDPGGVTALKYRGDGWPGLWTLRHRKADGGEKTASLTYDESWSFLQKYRQWRCYICPDHTGEFADIAVGDPWYREVQEGEAGQSLIVARTQRGLDLVNEAVEAGYITLINEDESLLPRSQPGLLGARGALWARLVTLRILGGAVPDYKGFALFRYWMSELSLARKLNAFTGTAKRLFSKGLRGRISFAPWVPDHLKNRDGS